MVNDKNHLYGPEDANKDRKNTEKRRDQQQFSRFSVAASSALNTAGLEPKAPATQIDTKVQIGDPYDDTKGSVSLSTQTVSFDVYGSNYTFYEVTGDVNFVFNELPTGRHITFTLDILVNQVAGVTIGFPTVTNPPVLAGNDGDRSVLEFIAVNRTDPTGVNPPVQTITFLGEGTSGVSFPLTPDISAKGNVTGAVDIDLSATTAHYQEMILIGNITFTFSNPPVDNKEISFLIDMTQDATGGRTVTWPTSVRVDPTVGSGANDRTIVIVTTVDNGTNYDALIVTGGEVDAANKQLSNLGVTAINADLLFNASTFDIGGTINPPDRVFTQALRLETGGSLLTTAVMIRNNATHLQMNVPVNTDAYEFAWAGTNRAALTAPSNLSLFSLDKINLSSDLQFQNIASDPAVAGNMRMNGIDVKVFSGGAVRNLSDIGSGGGPEFADNLFRITGSVDATKKVAFEVDGLTTATTRTITAPDTNFTLAGLGTNQTWGGVNTFSSQINLNGNIAGSGSLARDLIPDSDATRVLGSGTLKFAGIFTTIVRFNASTQFIIADANGIRLEIPTGDVFNLEINNIDQLTLSATALNVHGNDITNTGNILSTSGNVDVGDSTGFDAFFGRRIEFPNVLGVATAANREIISTTVSAVNTIKMNLPLNEDFMITENNITSPPAFLLDTSAGTLTLDDPIFAFRINNSAVFSITKFDTGAAIFTSNSGFSFSDIVKILTPAGDTALEFDGIDGAPDVGLINTPANVDFEYSAGGTNKMRFDASNNEFQFNADIVRIQERLNIKETTVTPPTPPTGQSTIFLFNDGTAKPNQSIRVKFDSGDVQIMATET